MGDVVQLRGPTIGEVVAATLDKEFGARHADAVLVVAVRTDADTGRPRLLGSWMSESADDFRATFGVAVLGDLVQRSRLESMTFLSHDDQVVE